MRPPLRRPATGFVVAGVCTALAQHLDLRVKDVRLITILLSLAGGLGAVGYIFLWVTIPVADGTESPKSVLDARLAKAPTRQDGGPAPWYARFPVRDIFLGLILLAGAGTLVATRFGYRLEWTWVLSALVVLIGLALAWSQLDSAQRGDLVRQSGGKTSSGMLRLAGGGALVIVGALLLAGQEGGMRGMWSALIAAIAVLIGMGLVLAPWWLRLVRQLGQERAAKEREATRADIAAHLHDSVLQTLALIQRSAEAPGEVTRLARNQERELRLWLYNDRSAAGTSVADQMRELAAEVENSMTMALGGHSAVSIDLVVVGDCAPDANTEALLAATGEALKNAVRHGLPPVAAYVEVSPGQVEAYVTDRGAGFDVNAIADDRFGVRQSIIGRVERRGGSAKIRQLAAGGTEVALSMPRELPEPEKDKS